MKWTDFCAWTHETAMRRSEKGTDDREKAEFLEIWGLGLGGEFLEFLPEVLVRDREASEVVSEVLSFEAKEELGDCLYYIARLYVDVGHERQPVVWTFGASVQSMARHVGRVVEFVKKALRKHGRPGLVALTLLEGDWVYCCSEGKRYEEETGANALDHPGECAVAGSLSGRRAEFGKLLDMALSAIESWLVARGSSLDEVTEINRTKLEKRRAEGTITSHGESFKDMIREVAPLGEIQGMSRDDEGRLIKQVGRDVNMDVCPRDTNLSTWDRGNEIPQPKRNG